MGRRCWRDFFPFSLCCCDLVGNKFRPCAQAGFVVPMMVLRAESLPFLLSFWAFPCISSPCAIAEGRDGPVLYPPACPSRWRPPLPGRLLCSVMDFYPAAIQVRWFQAQQELSEHVVATEVVPNGDWTYQLLVYSCQVEHVSLEQPLSLRLLHQL
uniref:Ig-like domain-containing protein n=1 Tax=Zonotrichia albicollis TaxID=44394 RepID=A0A8D2MPB0_ZONAL